MKISDIYRYVDVYLLRRAPSDASHPETLSATQGWSHSALLSRHYGCSHAATSNP
jgi:hypothetical protein